MDEFFVPKKVNRHVIKALSALSGAYGSLEVPIEDIIHQVKYQMRNLVPVNDIDNVINLSLYNLRASGLVKRTGPSRFALADVLRLEVSQLWSENRLSGHKSNKVPKIRPSNEAENSAIHENDNSQDVIRNTKLLPKDAIVLTLGGRRNNSGQSKQRGRSVRHRPYQKNRRPHDQHSCEPSTRKRQFCRQCHCYYVNKNFSYDCKDITKHGRNDSYYDTNPSTSPKLMEITEDAANYVNDRKTEKEISDCHAEETVSNKGDVVPVKVEVDDGETKENMEGNNCTSAVAIMNLPKALQILNSSNSVNQTESQSAVSTKSGSCVN